MTPGLPRYFQWPGTLWSLYEGHEVLVGHGETREVSDTKVETFTQSLWTVICFYYSQVAKSDLRTGSGVVWSGLVLP